MSAQSLFFQCNPCGGRGYITTLLPNDKAKWPWFCPFCGRGLESDIPTRGALQHGDVSLP